MTKTVFGTLAAVTALTAPAFAQDTHEWGDREASFEPAFENQTRAPLAASDYTYATKMLTEELEHPWAIEALPDGNGVLVTERPGRLVHVTLDGEKSEPIKGLPEIFNEPAGNSTQAGLLDVKVGPNFAEDRMVYITYAKGTGDGMSVTAAARGVLSEDMTELTQVEDIFVQTPPSPAAMHYGSRIVFDGDGHAFITTGEHFTVEERKKAQDLNTTYGKVIRVNLDGTVPEDNPFVGDEDAIDSIWSYGHRNVQGAAYHNGTLYVIEHGPAGGDEVNIPEAGKNYGWPVISYGVNYDGSDVTEGIAKKDGMEQPAYYWDPVIAPGDVAFYEGEMFPEWQGDMLIGGLVAPGIVRLEWDGNRVAHEERVLTQFGRVRDVEVLDDGSFLLATDYEQGELIHVTKGDGDS
ncbi:PQQ-dependent sugar dehydrogenase [Tropicibacter alexandrii]|uniref:PQQ-dependent sugar dehydrogenase n=1 Tax=Tropicibacter alexandrii TaxID=2267683 RepID=UPI000EF52764|nr:PQQ-dependent sugar dehydrogenase [Tropicibacter alexandrii]